MGYIKNILVGIDQLGNAMAGGNPDNTISARVGYNVNHLDTISYLKYWKFLEWVIDSTFFPIDGDNHCDNSYHNDEEELFYDQYTKNWAVAIVSIFIFITCPVFALILYPLYYLKIIGHDVSISHHPKK